MYDNDQIARDRRALMKNGLALAGLLAIPGAAMGRPFKGTGAPAPLPAAPAAPAAAAELARPVVSPKVVRPELFRRAMAALSQHGSRIEKHDRIAIVDFAASSSQPRFHFIDLKTSESKSLLVAHGSGSDPSHSGYLSRFSNEFGSNASSEGAFVTSDYYVGKHGRSQRLVGLDKTNDNALGRAIVLHSAWYANKSMIAQHGMLGRSQGCFAVGENDLDEVFRRLGPGRMIYADKV